MSLILTILTSAHAFWGIPVVPIGGTVPTTQRALAVVSLQDGHAIITWSHDQDGTEASMGLLVPTPAPADWIERSALDYVLRFDDATAPWREDLRCDDLVVRNDVDTAPGCRTTPWTAQPFPEPRIESVHRLDVQALQGSVFLDVLPDAVADDWLAGNGLELPPGGAEVVEAWQAAGLSAVAVRYELVEAVPGGFLPPVQIGFPILGELALRLDGAGDALGAADLTLWALSETVDGEVVDATHTRTSPPSDCMLPGDFGSAWTESTHAALDTPEAPAWASEWTGAVGLCDPACPGGPLDDLDLAAMAFEGAPDSTFLSRVHLRWDPGEWASDLVLVPAHRVAVTAQHYYRHDPTLEWLVPTCGEDLRQQAQCPEIALGGGCAVGPPVGIWVGLGAVVVLRRRRATTAALLATLPSTAWGAGWEVGASVVPVSTERLSVEHVAFEPGMGPPAIGLDLSWAFLVQRQRALGIQVAATGWRGDGVVGARVDPDFIGVDSSVLLHLRQGAWSTGPVRATAALAAGVAVPCMDSSVWTGACVLTADIEGGGGVLLGEGARRWLVELRGRILPRTDGTHVDFDDRTNLPGWIWHHGQIAGVVRVALAIGPPTEP